MKLRNKITGAIHDIDELPLGLYNSLAEIMGEWEDYEEPKEYWYIDEYGSIDDTPYVKEDEVDQTRMAIGNFFTTREEADKAREKLKAYKRLRDKGFRFLDKIRYGSLCGNGFDITITACMPPEYYTDTETSKDLDLLFGGEE